MTTALSSHTACPCLSVTLELAEPDWTTSTDSTCKVTLLSWQLEQLLTVQMSGMALPHTALQVTPALTGFPSTSNAVSTQHTALSVRCHAHFGLQTFSSASLHNKQALCVLQEKPSFSAIYKHGLLPHCSHTVPGAKNYFGDPQKYSSFIYSAFGHVSDSRSHYYQLKIISCMPINKGKRHWCWRSEDIISTKHL